MTEKPKAPSVPKLIENSVGNFECSLCGRVIIERILKSKRMRSRAKQQADHERYLWEHVERDHKPEEWIATEPAKK
jgi:hypothetical protein